jgi:hypothetical protein
MDLDGFATLLDARYTEIKEQEYAGITDIIPQIYTTRRTDRLDQFHTSIGGLSDWEEFTGQLHAQRQYEQYQSQSRPRAFATMTIITRRLVQTDLSGVLDGKRFRPMVRAGMLTKQKHATELFEMLTVNDHRWFVRSEGVPIVSNSHLTRTPGVSTAVGFDNYTPDALTPVSILAGRIAGRKMKSAEGDRMDMYYDTIVLPVDGVDTYNEIANTRAGFDVPSLNENQASKERTGITRVIVLPLWTSTTGWALVNYAMMRENCIWWTLEDEDYGSIVEFDTLQIKNRGYMDHGPMVDDWRWIYAGGM